MEYLKGIDVSHHNALTFVEKTITNAEQSNASLDFLIAKATEGYRHKDNMFDVFMALAYNHGLLRGAYHYVNPKSGGVDATFIDDKAAYNEASNFVSQVRPYGDCILVLDFEENYLLTQSGVDYLYKVAANVNALTNTPPLIYMSEWLLKKFDFSKIAQLGCGIWIAKWKSGYCTPINDVGWVYNKAESGVFSTLAMQQISSKVEIDGNIKPLDTDIAFMSVKAWDKYANPRLYKNV